MRIFFTRHSQERIKTRGILRQEVVDSIRDPDKIKKRYGNYYFQKNLSRGSIQIVCEKKEKNLKVITVYWE